MYHLGKGDKKMIDYEDLIMARQEAIEIAEDNYAWEPEEGIEYHYNPILLRAWAEYEENRKRG